MSGDVAVSSVSPAVAVRSLPTSIDSLGALRAIRRHWPLVLLLAIGLPVLAGLALSRLAPTYTATGTMLYAPLDFNSKLLRGVLAANRVTDRLMASQASVIRSLPAMRAVAGRLHLADDPGFDGPAGRVWFWRRWPGLRARPAKPVSQTRLIARFRTRFTVRVPAGSQLLDVSFDSHDPNLAARAVNAAMAVYLDRQRTANLAVLNHAQAWLTRRAAATGKRLEALDIAIADARAASDTERGTSSTPLTNQAAGRLADSLVVAQTDLATAQARLGTETGGSASATSAAVAPDIAPMRAREARLVAKLGALAGSDGPNYPAVRATRHALAALRGQISAETVRLVAADRARMHADQARVATLTASLAAIRRKTASESILAAPLAGLEEQRDAERNLLRAQTEQIGALESRSALTRPDARIVSRATPPEQPSAPRSGIIITGALLLGLSAGVLAALSADALNPGFRSGGEIRAMLDLPCVALIPEVKRRARRGMTMPEYALANPFSPFNEQIRAVRTSLWLDPGAPRSLAVTAARPGEGKTTLATSVAVALAASGLRVLAIDCDIRQPSFDALFGLGGLPGLTDHLAGRVGLDQAIHQASGGLPGEVVPVDLMPAGAVATDALSLFMSERLSMMMAALRERYDLVILDLPPVFALAEAQVLARAADTTVLCIRWGHTPRLVAGAAVAMLDQAGIKLAGSVLTRVDGARHARAGFADSELYHPRYGGYFRS